ncbi:MAG: hypothetical protein IKN24_05375 [Lachnospiraceae bacterium]|nr:hypothetical protein [Lachnospiraceae bacterium]
MKNRRCLNRLITIIILAMALCACNTGAQDSSDDGKKSSKSSKKETTEDVPLTRRDPGEEDPAETQDATEELLTEDDDVDIDPWTMDPYGGYTLPGSEWPDNEFTRLVPAPDFKLMTSFTEEDEFTAAFQSLEVSQIKTYAEKVKKSGFTIDAEEESQEVYGIVVYTYTAYNEEGYCVQISFASGGGAVAISR